MTKRWEEITAGRILVQAISISVNVGTYLENKQLIIEQRKHPILRHLPLKWLRFLRAHLEDNTSDCFDPPDLAIGLYTCLRQRRIHRPVPDRSWMCWGRKCGHEIVHLTVNPRHDVKRDFVPWLLFIHPRHAKGI